MESVSTAFAVLDVLGYGALMAKEPTEVVHLINELATSSTRNWPVQRDLDRFAKFSNTSPSLKVEYLCFADTLLIYLRDNEAAPELLRAPAQLVETVCYATSLTLATFLATGIPLRGAIGFGPSFISTDPLFFTGMELYQTFKLERCQAWAGAALHDSASNVLSPTEHAPFVIEYCVPMTDSITDRSNRAPKLAVDWVTPLGVPPELVPPWEEMFSKDDVNVKRKWTETYRFFQHVKSDARSFPLGVAKSTIEDMRTRLARILA
jgi:hypothetical protein